MFSFQLFLLYDIFSIVFTIVSNHNASSRNCMISNHDVCYIQILIRKGKAHKGIVYIIYIVIFISILFFLAHKQ